MRIGVAGLGFMGSTHLQAMRSIPGPQVAAGFSKDEKKLAGDLTAVGGNLGIQGQQMDFSQVRKYRDLEALLNDPELDAVDLCLPTHLHAASALYALRAGKHVLVEKPLALSGAQADEVISEAQRGERVFMVAHVLRFLPPYRALSDAVKSDRYGRVRSATFQRRCAAPHWSAWLGDPAKSGGGIFDLLIHDVDMCLHLFGPPTHISATGHEDFSKGIDLVHGTLYYPHFEAVVAGGWHHPKSYPFSMEYTVSTDQATFQFSSRDGQVMEHNVSGEASHLRLDEEDPFASEIGYFIECCRTGTYPRRCPPEESAAAVKLTLALAEARLQRGEKIQCPL